MDVEYMGRVLVRLQPFVKDHVIRRSRIDRVLGTLRTPPENLAAEIDRLLAKAGIDIEEDCAPVDSHHDTSDRGLTVTPERDHEPPPRSSDTSASARDDAVEVARRRILADRHIPASKLASTLLRSDEEVGLAILVRGEAGKPLEQGDFTKLSGEAREAAVCLLLHNQRLVRSVAKRYTPSGMTVDDLFQHGMVGLIRAVELFDPKLGNKFSTYAMNWVRQAITRAIANESRMIRLPVHMYERVQKVWQTHARLTVDGEAPSIHELALACELTDREVTECLTLGRHDILSLDTPVAHDAEATLGDIYESADPYADPEREIVLPLLQSQIATALGTLREREAAVVSMRFGLLDDSPKTLDEIGQSYGVTRERIRQIEKKAMGQLQDPSCSRALRAFMYGTDDGPMIERRHGAEPS
ncbi:sigma-70 family RNA polymerase sigma factor [Nocardia cyriacigeorgica]|uniref:RNA polymerase sigma factor n=1 Tax=Nocardia cyriacigeorgica TaxID=135487 RepID=A0A5R8PFL8_9NOCA|nr:sigma-70 family RNA polymerase sigma factor [Nocardia cyriacigeorgica]TLG10238.1 sigma-70 family RNA polymerase sigma factor [Nocardia cyriacigeorgica]